MPQEEALDLNADTGHGTGWRGGIHAKLRAASGPVNRWLVAHGSHSVACESRGGGDNVRDTVFFPG